MQPKEIIYFGAPGMGMELHFSLDSDDTDKKVSLFKCVIHAGARMPVPHYHESFDETVYGLKGTVTYTIDGKEVKLGPGDCAFVPRGVVHSFQNRTDETIEFLAFISPGIFGSQYFKDLAAVVNAGGPPDLNMMKTVMLNHGLVPVLN